MAKKKVETKATPKTKKTEKAKTVKAAATPVVVQDTHQVLQRWNLVAGVLLGLQAAAVALLGATKTVPVVLHYPALDTLATEANKQDVFGVAARQLFDMPIAYLIAAGLLAMALVHLAVATRFQLQFAAIVDRGINTARWLAYGVGGMLLLDAVYLLSGITDVITLKLLGAALIGACVSALAVELLGPGRKGLSRLLKVAALVGGLLPWLAIAYVMAGAMLYDGNVPSYMYGVYASGFILFVAVGLALYFRWLRRGRWANTLYSEKMFLILGVVTATVLSWQLFAGALL